MKGVLEMKQGRYWLERLADQADLSGESLSVMPLVEIAGNRRVLIEGHRGVTQYGCDCICVRVSYGTVAVNGIDLELAQMTKAQLIIRGKIHKITLIGRNP